MNKRIGMMVATVVLAAATGMAQGNANRMATEGLVSAWLSGMQMEVDWRLAERPTYPEVETIAAAAAEGMTPGHAWRQVHVDQESSVAGETGSAAAPFRTIGAALAHIGQPANAAEYGAKAGRAYTVRVAAGVYEEDLNIPYRPSILLDLDGATVRGTVTRLTPDWPRNASNLISRLTIRGDSLRAAYPDGQHAVTFETGDYNVTNAAFSVDLDAASYGA